MEKLIEFYHKSKKVLNISSCIKSKQARLKIKGMSGSFASLIAASVIENTRDYTHVLILPDKESAFYFASDLEALFHDEDKPLSEKRVLVFPNSFQKYNLTETDHTQVLLRAEVLNRLSAKQAVTIVLYPEALAEKVVSQKTLSKNTFSLYQGELVSEDFLYDFLSEYGFTYVDFVSEPGQYAVRGGILDVFSYSNEHPFRIEFSGDKIESLRSFDILSQLSIEKLEKLTLIPDLQNESSVQHTLTSFSEYLPEATILWMEDMYAFVDKNEKFIEKTSEWYFKTHTHTDYRPENRFEQPMEFMKAIQEYAIIEFGQNTFFKEGECISFEILPQPVFNKKFELFISDIETFAEKGYVNYIGVENAKQVNRLERICNEFQSKESSNHKTSSLYSVMELSLAKGFVDTEEKILFYTDHELFDRYYKYKVKTYSQDKETLSVKELMELKPGDFVTHIDHGVGRFSGLEKIEVNGKVQETIRLLYKDNDILYVSIHSLHKISRYVGKDGAVPSLNRLGSSTWQNLKVKTKQRLKDIAKELIALYAKRRASKGFAFSPDSYLQYELEASFIYEDTPDQYKATADVKRDMESSAPMDRLVCGDVGFGKTEIAIRAAFKAVADNKQVSVLVPTTILAYQHYNTFKERLRNFPCNVEYISRFRSGKDKARILKELKEGKVDILIGTHALIGKSVEFKDLGLLIIDEEQKFGVSVKEKLRKMKVEVDSLTLTATPIPRTLQFSLMGARDLSIISTPPPNRQPVQTELQVFDEELIKEAVLFEISRGGQVYFVNNNIQSLMELNGMLQRLVPNARIALGHGQMEGDLLEKVMLDFIEGDYDVLLCTSIVENGLDIPNANTIIINNAQNFGLSDLHQLRGRVGRSNIKSFCYLLVPSFSILTDEARKRLKAIEEFSAIGSGFNIAMRDLDIRGAGNILGAEQSGFIADMGYETYQKILNEAVEELKMSEFKELYQEEVLQEEGFVQECSIETDLEILIPDRYISSMTERLVLYKELDGMEKEEELAAFKSRLVDRFGEVPPETLDLIQTIRLRVMAKKIGFEKLVLKQGKMTAHFIANPDNPYYQSETFGKVIQFAQNNPKECLMRQNNDKLTLSFSTIKSVSDALAWVERIKSVV